MIHTITPTDAATADTTQLPALLHGQEKTLQGDKAYYKSDQRLSAPAVAPFIHAARNSTLIKDSLRNL
ncbi:hypothetical protein [Gemmatimonas sp.]|uniref:hypothetical protein n=1 Tax=Gemmatimonas sp. TaxID=1962908 RepID=UPI0025BCA1BB|nr:hypothetical protein [Gemmatimonas sp.]MCA2992516.1 hypothetical protein [Gemmatimonas sp.]